MNIELNGRGAVAMASPSQCWKGNKVMQTAMFAGEEMLLLAYDDGLFSLRYLSFKNTGFTSMEEAKASAPAFAKAVLAHMASLIQDDL